MMLALNVHVITLAQIGLDLILKALNYNASLETSTHSTSISWVCEFAISFHTTRV